MRTVAIAGAGLAGCVAAISLARRGYQVEIYERRPDTRHQGNEFGRSINLALSARGAHGLSRVDLLDKVLASSVPMKARAIHSADGEIHYQPFGRSDSEYLSSIDRKSLHADLLDAVERYDNIALHFNQRLVGIDFTTMRLSLFDEVSQTTHTRVCQSLVATDGAFSTARKTMIDNGFAEFVESELSYGYKELPIPAQCGRDMAHEVLHLWPRRSFLMIANPNPDHSFGCTLFMPHEGQPSFSEMKTHRDIEGLFKHHFSDAYERMPTLVDDFLSRPTGRLPTVRGGPWYFEDKIVLLGDAAHALVPFFAQGMNSALEDCTIFIDCLEAADDHWAEALRTFFIARKPDADAIADMTMQNFHEIQDHIADDHFLLTKRVEQELMRRYPRIYMSMHSYVQFTRVNYTFAQACGNLQTALLDTICAGITDVTEVNWTSVETQLARYEAEIRHQAHCLGVSFETT
jgi:kynurenine 3-monooxygenase